MSSPTAMLQDLMSRCYLPKGGLACLQAQPGKPCLSSQDCGLFIRVKAVQQADYADMRFCGSSGLCFESASQELGAQ